MVNYDIELDVKDSRVLDTDIVLTQGDNTAVRFTIRVFNDGAAMTPTSAKIAFSVGGNVIAGDMAISGGTLTYTFQGNEVVTPGKEAATVVLVDSSGRVSAKAFTFRVAYNPLLAPNTPAGSYIPELEHIIEQAEEMIEALRQDFPSAPLMRADILNAFTQETPSVYALDAAAGKELNDDLNDVKETLTQLNGLITGHTNLFNDIISKEAAAHNAIYRGKNLTSVYTIEQLSAKVRSGDFSDLYIGDYITKAVTIGGTSYNVDWVFADFDYFLNMGDAQCTQHHIVMVPRSAIYSAQMNSTNTTANGYVGSAMWTAEMPKVSTGVQNAFGSGHVLSHKELLSTGMSTSLASMAGAGYTGATNNWAWQTVISNILNEPMVYGTKVFSSSFFDIGDRKSQLNIFRLKHSFATTRGYWWLSSVASGTSFAGVSDNGHAGNSGASASLGVRPYFLFY